MTLDQDSYSDWSAWSKCSAKCGAGSRTRTRRCLNQTCALHGEIHSESENCVEMSKCGNVPGCPVFFGDGFSDYDPGFSLLARTCQVHGQNRTFVAQYASAGFPDGSQCQLSCLHHSRLDLDSSGFVTCANGEWDHIPKCVSQEL